MRIAAPSSPANLQTAEGRRASKTRSTSEYISRYQPLQGSLPVIRALPQRPSVNSRAILLRPGLEMQVLRKLNHCLCLLHLQRPGQRAEAFKNGILYRKKFLVARGVQKVQGARKYDLKLLCVLGPKAFAHKLSLV